MHACWRVWSAVCGTDTTAPPLAVCGGGWARGGVGVATHRQTGKHTPSDAQPVCARRSASNTLSEQPGQAQPTLRCTRLDDRPACDGLRARLTHARSGSVRGRARLAFYMLYGGGDGSHTRHERLFACVPRRQFAGRRRLGLRYGNILALAHRLAPCAHTGKHTSAATQVALPGPCKTAERSRVPAYKSCQVEPTFYIGI